MFKRDNGDTTPISESRRHLKTGEINAGMSADDIFFKTFKRRYYMLGLYCALTWFNALAWFSISPISIAFMNVYEVDFIQEIIISLIYLIAFFPSVFLATFVFNKFDLRTGIVVGAVLQWIGVFSRYLVNYTSFWIMVLGQAFLIISQPFFLVSPALVATYWFEDSMRELAITLGTSLNTIWIALGSILPTFFVNDEFRDFDKTKRQITMSLLVQACIGVVLMLLALFTFQNKPAVPPSPNATVERDNALWKSYGKLFCNFEFLKLSVCFSLYFSIISVFSTVNYQVVAQSGYLVDFTCYLTIVYAICGFLGSLCYGIVLKKFKCYKTWNILIGVSSMISILIFYFASWFKIGLILLISYAFVGFSAFPTLIVTFVYNSEITLPIKETTSSGFFILGGQYIGLGLAFIVNYLIEEYRSKVILILVGTTMLGTISAILMKPIPKERNDILRSRAASTDRDSFLEEEE